jgi:predicted dehydrogenase
MATLRLGVLGAAGIAPRALIEPAKHVKEIKVVAIASRDLVKAKAFGKKHGVPRVHGSYDELLADPEVDAVYNPLPNGMHAEWSIRALKAGKPVLCEKPMASNAAEARRMKDVADETGLALVEAFHYRYHPIAAQLKQIALSGEIGDLVGADIRWTFDTPRSNIRFDYDLAGGSLMDIGCYQIHFLRFLTGQEPTVTAARAELTSDQVDGAMVADLHFPCGLDARVESSMISKETTQIMRIQGSKGELLCESPFLPQLGGRIRVVKGDVKTKVKIDRTETYVYQLRAFAAAVAGRTPAITGGDDAIRNMQVIDAVYQKAGLKVRGT